MAKIPLPGTPKGQPNASAPKPFPIPKHGTFAE